MVRSLLECRSWIHPEGPVERVFGIDERHSGGRVQRVHPLAGGAASATRHRYDLHQAGGCGAAHCEFQRPTVVSEWFVKRRDHRKGGAEAFSISSDQQDMIARLMEAT